MVEAGVPAGHVMSHGWSFRRCISHRVALCVRNTIWTVKLFFYILTQLNSFWYGTTTVDCLWQCVYTVCAKSYLLVLCLQRDARGGWFVIGRNFLPDIWSDSSNQIQKTLLVHRV